MATTSKATLLRLEAAGERPTLFQWQPRRSLWVKAQRKARQQVYSKLAVAMRSVVFELYRAGDITLHDAIFWQGQHCFITSIDQTRPACCEITAALVQPVACRAFREDTVLNELNRPVSQEQPLSEFPGCLSPKWAGYTQEEPQTTTETHLILTAPKAVQLRTGDLVEAGGTVYKVRLCHLTDPFQNDYEIGVEEES